MNNPLVSVVIPVYNGVKYLKEAIDSVLIQTYNNLEIVVVDDGSIDETKHIALSYGDKVRYFQKENGGVATALNMAIKEAKGEYISWLSHDDAYLPNKISSQVEVLSKLENKKTILYSNYQLMDDSSDIYEQCDLGTKHSQRFLDDGMYVILNELISGCTLMVKRELFEEFGYFRTDLLTTQDYDLWFNMLQKYPIKHVDKVLVNSRVHPEQDSRAKRAYHLKELDDLWSRFIKETSSEKLDELFEKKEKFLCSKAINCHRAFLFNTANQAMMKISKNKAKNILAINADKGTFDGGKIFYLEVIKENVSLSFNDTKLLEFKLSSPIGFEFNNMFLKNELTLLIEKILVAFDIEELQLYGIEGVGVDIIDTAKQAGVNVLYVEKNLEMPNEIVAKQMELFLQKYIQPALNTPVLEKKSADNNIRNFVMSDLFSMKV